MHMCLESIDFDFFVKMENADPVIAARFKFDTFIKGNFYFVELNRSHLASKW
jgi:hypothetical protein